jgi:hypothetical protein
LLEDVSSSPEKKTSGGKSPKSPKGPRKRKKTALCTRKSKRMAYGSQVPELETLKSLNEDALETITQQIENSHTLNASNIEVDSLNNNCNDFIPEISNVSGNVKTFDTDNERPYIEDKNNSEVAEAPVHLEKKETLKDIDPCVSMETSVSEQPVDHISKIEAVQDTVKLTTKDVKSKSPRRSKSVKSLNKKGRKGKRLSKKHGDNGSDTDTTIEWSEHPDSPGIPSLEDDSAKQIKKEPEDFPSK